MRTYANIFGQNLITIAAQPKFNGPHKTDGLYSNTR
jgi:hypothetical protein